MDDEPDDIIRVQPVPRFEQPDGITDVWSGGFTLIRTMTRAEFEERFSPTGQPAPRGR